jgi:hypothetical protein
MIHADQSHRAIAVAAGSTGVRGLLKPELSCRRALRALACEAQAHAAPVYMVCRMLMLRCRVASGQNQRGLRIRGAAGPIVVLPIVVYTEEELRGSGAWNCLCLQHRIRVCVEAAAAEACVWLMRMCRPCQLGA